MKLIKKIIPLFFIAILSLNLFAGGRSSQSDKRKRYTGGHREGDGGIDVILPSGRHMPIESYIETFRTYYPSVCDMMVPLEDDGADSKVWKEMLNQLIERTYNKLPALGEILFDSLEEKSLISSFFLLDTKGVELKFTDDHSEIISEEWLRNGTVRLGSAVNIDTKAWEDFFYLGSSEYKYSHLLTRVIHEALIPYYVPRDKVLLGEVVREIIRMAGYFNENNSHISLKDMNVEEGDDYLIAHGIQSELLPLNLLDNVYDPLHSWMHSSVVGVGTPYVGGNMKNFKNAFETGLSSEEIYFAVSKNSEILLNKFGQHMSFREKTSYKEGKKGSTGYKTYDKAQYFFYSLDELNNFPAEVYKLLSPEKMIELSELKRKLQIAPVLCK